MAANDLPGQMIVPLERRAAARPPLAGDAPNFTLFTTAFEMYVTAGQKVAIVVEANAATPEARLGGGRDDYAGGQASSRSGAPWRSTAGPDLTFQMLIAP